MTHSAFLLASASPRRRQLLEQAGFRFTVRTADVDETAFAGEDAIQLAVRLAAAKARAAAAPGMITVGADTVVAAPGGELLGKPAHAADAARMLRLLAGATHSVVTGVCVHTAARTEAAAAVTFVTFASLDETEIAAYAGSPEPVGKAGGYAIQGYAAQWTTRIVGEYTNVVGLPLFLTASMLRAFGIVPSLG